MASLLPAIAQQSIRPVLHHAFPLCIILTDDSFDNWVQERFINIFAHIRVKDETVPWAWRKGDENEVDKKAFWLDYVDLEFDYHAILRQSVLDAGEVVFKNPYNFVKDCISGGEYLIVYLDRFYLPVSPWFQELHILTQYLVYGFDSTSEDVMLIGLGKRNHFQDLRLNKSVFEKCVREAIKNVKSDPSHAAHDQGLVRIIKKREFFGQHPFRPEFILSAFEDYLQCKADLSKYYMNNGFWFNFDRTMMGSDNESQFLGICVFDGLLQACELVKARTNVSADDINSVYSVLTYAQPNFLQDHKGILLDRMKNITMKLDLNPKFCSNYMQVLEAIEVIKMLFLKYFQSGDSSLMDRVSRVIKECKLVEEDVLSEFVAEFRQKI